MGGRGREGRGEGREGRGEGGEREGRGEGRGEGGERGGRGEGRGEGRYQSVVSMIKIGAIFSLVPRLFVGKEAPQMSICSII